MQRPDATSSASDVRATTLEESLRSKMKSRASKASPKRVRKIPARDYFSFFRSRRFDICGEFLRPSDREKKGKKITRWSKSKDRKTILHLRKSRTLFARLSFDRRLFLRLRRSKIGYSSIFGKEDLWFVGGLCESSLRTGWGANGLSPLSQ